MQHGNGGFLPGASIFSEKPGWIEAEYLDYGYCSMEVVATQMTIEVGGNSWTSRVQL
jgi:hypothetical protein